MAADLGWDGIERRGSDDRSVCSHHDRFVQILTGSAVDVKWLKYIGYGLLLATVGALGSLWGILIPQLSGIQAQIHRLESTAAVTSQRLSDLAAFDQDSKVDRKELHEQVQALRSRIQQVHPGVQP